MARTVLTPISLVKDGMSVVDGAVAVDPTNGHVVSVGGLSGDLVIIVNNTHAATHVVTIKAGNTNPPAFTKDLGDITGTMTASSQQYFGPFTSARIQQSGTDAGKVYIDLAAGITGTITALLIPRDVAI